MDLKSFVKKHSYACSTPIKKGVTAWEEVKKDELPGKVKEKIRREINDL